MGARATTRAALVRATMPAILPLPTGVQHHSYDCHAVVDLDGISCSKYDDDSASAGEEFLEELLVELTLDSNEFSSVHAACSDINGLSRRRRLGETESVTISLGLGIDATTTGGSMS